MADRIKRVIYWINIAVLAGLTSFMLVGASHAASHNPWSLYPRNGGTATLTPKFTAPLPAWQVPSSQAQRQMQRQMQVEPFGSDYVPLPGSRNYAVPPPPYGYQQPYRMPPRYPYGGGFGGQFGFGMSPGFGAMPFGFGAQPFGRTANPYGGLPYGGTANPYGGMPFGGLPSGNMNPWGMGFPMF